MTAPFIRFHLDHLTPCVEPKKRWVGGRYGWAAHRFAIKGGITRMDALARDMSEALYRKAREPSYFKKFLDAGWLK